MNINALEYIKFLEFSFTNKINSPSQLSQDLFALYFSKIKKDVSLKQIPCVLYAKGVNYIPMSTVLKSLATQKKPMIRNNLLLSTKNI